MRAEHKQYVAERKDPKKMFAKVNKEALMWVLLIPTVLMFTYTQWAPVCKGIWTSFFKTKGYEAIAFCGLENYKNVLTDTLFLTTLINTVKYVMYSLLIGFVPSIVLALFINEIVHGKAAFRIITYIPNVAPTLAVSIIWACLLNPAPNGLLNSILGVFGVAPQQWLLNANMTIPLIIISMTWQSCAGNSLIYLSALQSVSQDLYEAAVIDGAGIWRRLFKITLPQISPTILLLFVRQIINIFQIMEQPLVMTDGGPNNMSLSLNLSAYKMAFSYMQVGRALALGTVSFFILIVITVFYFRLNKKISE